MSLKNSLNSTQLTLLIKKKKKHIYIKYIETYLFISTQLYL